MRISAVTSEADLAAVRKLMDEYHAFLLAALGEHVCGSSLARELPALPAPYDRAPGVLLLARDDTGAPAGCAGLRAPSLPDAGAALEMKRLWVSPAFRGRGAGRKLIQACLDHARAQHMGLVLDTVPAVMPEAVALYRSMGFEEIPAYNNSHAPGSVFMRAAR